MRFVFTSYSSSPEFKDPKQWLSRIEGYTGILQRLGRRHTVIGIERIDHEEVLEDQGVHYHFIRMKKKVSRFPWRLNKLVKSLEPDVVFINGFIFPLQIIQLRMKLGRRVRIIVIHRAERPFGGVRKYIQRMADRCVDAYLFISSEFGKHWISCGNIADLGKIHEVLHGSSVFQPANRTVSRSVLSINGSPVFLWVGRLDANKDPLTVVRGFLNFLLVSPLARLYMIYHTEELLADVQELINDDAIGKEAIHLVGRVSHAQLQEWYNSADFIVSGSHYEGGGISVCEAMSCGCIPVVTDIISFRRMTGPGHCGLLYEPGNVAALTAALLKTAGMDAEEERQKTLRQFTEELSFEAIARKIERVVDGLQVSNRKS